MSDDYLWDGSGEPDPEVRRLELLLGRLRHNQAAPELPELRPSEGAATEDSQSMEVSRFRLLWPGFASAAGILLVIAGFWFAARLSRPALHVARLSGEPTIGSGRISSTGRLMRGDWLQTDGSSRARITVGEIGHVEVEPHTRIRLVESRVSEQRLALARGKMHASILAPPRIFVVETPAAVAVDLGCTYTLAVDDSGASILEVTSGWVALEEKGRVSVVPAGALCWTRPGVGPGTPYFKDSSAAFQAALDRFDFGGGGRDAIDVLLTESRKRDTLSLWHLLSRVDEAERIRLYERIAAFVPPPRGVTREGVLELDKKMLDYWRDELEWSW